MKKKELQMNIRLLTYTTAAIALGSFSAAVMAETTTTKTTVQQQDVPNLNKVNLTVFDLDKNGVLTMNEVGKYLFKVFDTDGNGSIDNIEFKKSMFMTIIPMEKKTLKLVDFDDDGHPEVSERTYENFVKSSQLARFDDDNDGLSANEFIGQGYEELDDDNDRLINLHEWEKAYKTLTSPVVNDPALYNK